MVSGSKGPGASADDQGRLAADAATEDGIDQHEATIHAEIGPLTAWLRVATARGKSGRASRCRAETSPKADRLRAPREAFHDFILVSEDGLDPQPVTPAGLVQVRGRRWSARGDEGQSTTAHPHPDRKSHRVAKRVGDGHPVLGESTPTSASRRPGLPGASTVTITFSAVISITNRV